MKNALQAILLSFLVITSCNEAPEPIDVNEEAFFVPDDNPITSEKVLLGRHLFYEKGLSIDSSVSCASCHIQQFAFADTARVSRGFQGDTGFRNATTLTNVAYQTAFFRDGGVKTLERAVHPPVLTEFEMNMNPDTIIKRLKKDDNYIKLFNASFEEKEISYKQVVYALATFQRQLNSFQAPYDAFIAGDTSALTAEQKRGLDLFRSGNLGCTNCHIEPLFIDNQLHNIGIYQTYSDYGLGRVTLDSADYGKIRTPTLRNIARTYPYMHDGSMATLEEVVDFYASGGENHPNKSADMKSFSISVNDKRALISFLESLTDSTFINNPKFSKPWR